MTAGIAGSGVVRFILNGERVEVSDAPADRTLLQYLREDAGLTGTKEGCAEGDCGACTVVLIELSRGAEQLSLRAINACIRFLPTINGCELLTVEGLAASTDQLHPVQTAMIDCDGSQCGFCTPGIVMSLFAHYKTSTDGERRTIDDALAGNLCRCTGYQAIVNAAAEMYALSADDEDWLRRADDLDDPARRQALADIQPADALAFGNAACRLDSPHSSEQLADLLGKDPDATIVAGATDVALWVNKQFRQIGHLVYTGRVADMLGCAIGEQDIDIGAAETLDAAMPVLLADYPEMSDLYRRFASPPIRNAATLGGNIANGSPIGDSMPALLALDCRLRLFSKTGRREVRLDEFYTGYQRTVLHPGEFIERILVPRRSTDLLFRTYKVSKRFDQDISALCAGISLVLDGDEVAEARVAFGGMAAIPSRARRSEKALVGKLWNADTVAEAMKALDADFDPISDMRASAAYRAQVARNLLWRCWLEAGGASVATDVYGYER